MCCDGRLHRAAVAVPQDHHQRHLQFGDRILDAAFHHGPRAANHVPRDANHEQVAHALIEQNLRRHARVAAGDDRRLRKLPAASGE